MDQASGLKNLFSAMAGEPNGPAGTGQGDGLLEMPGKPRRRCRAIAVAGGKGGVGKSTVSVNLGMSLSMAGHDVMLLDADMGLANVDVLLGLTPSRHIGHLLDGECGLEDLILEAPRGLRVIPAGSGARRLAQLDNGEHAAVIRASGSDRHEAARRSRAAGRTESRAAAASYRVPGSRAAPEARDRAR